MDARSLRERVVTGLYATMYLGYAGVGLFQFLTPSPAVRAEAGALTIVWAAMLLLGGILGAVGQVEALWLPELTAQPLLAASYGLWAYSIGFGSVPPNWAFVCLCAALIARSAGRALVLWADVRRKERW